MSNLLDYKLLSFDVYGTLVDWEQGVLTALEPLVSKMGRHRPGPAELLSLFAELETSLQTQFPDMAYSDLLAQVHALMAVRLNQPKPSVSDSVRFGASVGDWPAFPDTVEALHRLAKTYRLLILSNVDRQSFERTNAGSLGGINFDAILTAQDIGSYKPALANFRFMLDFVERKFGIGKHEILQTAQSQFHDHQPAAALGIRSIYIQRDGACIGNVASEVYDWKFSNLAELADEVDAQQRRRSKSDNHGAKS